MLPERSDYEIHVTELKFQPPSGDGERTARMRGLLRARNGSSHFTFGFSAAYDPQAQKWFADIRNLNWHSRVPPELVDLRNTQLIALKVMQVFQITWIRSVLEPGKTGARLAVGTDLKRLEDHETAFAIFRAETLGLHRPEWKDLWPAIENRIANDPEFWISGFTREHATRAVAVLKTVFSWEWVRRRYRQYAKEARDAGMWDDIFADQGFPAYLLARTAVGCICKDPGWNYLITLAEACRRLQTLPKGKQFLNRIAGSESGHIHQANFAGFLLQHGVLEELEPPTGSGSATHDVSARGGSTVIDIEMKAITSANASRQISREIADKCRKLPGSVSRPVVFFVLLLPTSVASNHRALADQLASITPAAFTGAAGVSALVVGQMFVEPTGGPIRWDFGKFLLNPLAARPVSEDLLRAVFQNDLRPLAYPLLPIVFTFGTGVGS
jgi:hypothetical protein